MFNYTTKKRFGDKSLFILTMLKISIKPLYKNIKMFYNMHTKCVYEDLIMIEKIRCIDANAKELAIKQEFTMKISQKISTAFDKAKNFLCISVITMLGFLLFALFGKERVLKSEKKKEEIKEKGEDIKENINNMLDTQKEQSEKIKDVLKTCTEKNESNEKSYEQDMKEQQEKAENLGFKKV